MGETSLMLSTILSVAGLTCSSASDEFAPNSGGTIFISIRGIVSADLGVAWASVTFHELVCSNLIRTDSLTFSGRVGLFSEAAVLAHKHKIP